MYIYIYLSNNKLSTGATLRRRRRKSRIVEKKISTRQHNLFLLTYILMYSQLYWHLFIYFFFIKMIARKYIVNILSLFIFASLNFLLFFARIHSRPYTSLFFFHLAPTNTEFILYIFQVASQHSTLSLSGSLIVLFNTYYTTFCMWKRDLDIVFYPTVTAKKKTKKKMKINLFQLLLKKSFTWRGFSTK